MAKGQEAKVLRLKKALYDLKQAPHAWYNKIDQYFINQGFRMSKSEPTLYIKTQGQHTLLLSICRCLIYTRTNTKMLMEFKENMMKTFEMTNLSLMSYFLGIEVSQRNDGIFISQKKYTKDLLKKFKMYGCKPVSTPLMMNEKLKKVDGAPEADASRYRSLVGSLLYLTATRPNIMFATSLLSRFMQNPTKYILA